MEVGGGGGASSDNPPTIKPINKGAIHRICAGQVILDLSSAVKELVENSLDAGATCIEISLKEYGEEMFQVIDNGCGISPNNFKVLALKHHTSKLTDFPDLQSLTTFGFRGEALSSLCALGELTVETRTQNEQVATHLTFDHSGVLTAEKKTARQIGTTVTVHKLFSNLPVRSKEFHRNIRKEYGKLISLLNAYALVAKGVRFVCSNANGRNPKSVVLKTQGSGSLKDNIITVFGMSTFTCLEPVSICISDACKVDGFLSKSGNGSGRYLSDRQYFFVNGRPVDMPKVGKLVNELYRSANSKQYPIAIMNFTVPTRTCDVNVTPDKRKIFFSDEKSIIVALREALEKIYSPDDASYSVQRPEIGTELSLKHSSPGCNNPEEEASGEELFPDTDDANVRSLPLTALDVINNAKYVPPKKDFALRVHGINRPDNSFTSQSGQLTGNKNSAASDKPGPPDRIDMQKKIRDKVVWPCCTGIVQSSLTNFVTVNKRKHESISNTLSEVPLLRNGSTFHQSVNEDSDMLNAFSRSPAHQNMDDDTSEVLHQKEQSSEVDKNQREPSKGSMAEKGFTESDVSHSSKAIMDIQEFEEPTMEQLMTHSSKFLLPTSTTTSPPVTDNGLSLTYALVVLNQRLPTYTPLLWNRAQLRLCADGGANRVFDELPLFFPLEDPSSVRQRYKPDVIKGDMDSIRTEVLDFYTKMGTKVVDESQDQDTTDLHKCIAFIRDVIPHQEKSDLCILVAGALGGRFDHEVGNINVLCHFSTTRIVLLSDDSLIQLLPGTHRHEIHIQSSVEGPHCGLVPIGTPSASTTTTGLKWDLNNTEMRFGGLVSTSNIVKGDIVTVQSSSDLLWTISLRKP